MMTENQSAIKKRQKNSYFQRNDLGILSFSGKDQVDFIQRQTTNDLDSLSITNPISSVLTSSTGRILDVLELFQIDEHSIFCISLYPDKTHTFLKNKIFFMDKVEITNQSHQYQKFDIILAEKNELFLNNLRKKYSTIIFPLFSINNNYKESIYRIVINIDAVENLLNYFTQENFSPLSQNEYEVSRISIGIPSSQNELIEDFTPLEMQMNEFISLTKGCYTGQEIISRQINYDKITKTLVSITSNQKIYLGDQIKFNRKNIGKITSSAQFSSKNILSLGVIKKIYSKKGTGITIKSNDGEIDGIIN